MNLSNLSLMLAIFGSALAVGGGVFEMSMLVPQWSKLPPSTFSIIQSGTGIPLQNFWMPVHILITLSLLLSLLLNWYQPTRRYLVLAGMGFYLIMRVWSALYFIPEMLEFQQIPLDSDPTQELNERVRTWAQLTWLREPLDLGLFFSLLWALSIEPTRENS